MRTRNAAYAMILAATLAAPTMAVAQDSPTTAQAMDDRDDGGEWGWIGLLGLIGLMGLKRKDRVDVTTTRRTTP